MVLGFFQPISKGKAVITEEHVDWIFWVVKSIDFTDVGMGKFFHNLDLLEGEILSWDSLNNKMSIIWSSSWQKYFSCFSLANYLDCFEISLDFADGLDYNFFPEHSNKELKLLSVNSPKLNLFFLSLPSIFPSEYNMIKIHRLKQLILVLKTFFWLDLKLETFIQFNSTLICGASHRVLEDKFPSNFQFYNFRNINILSMIWLKRIDLKGANCFYRWWKEWGDLGVGERWEIVLSGTFIHQFKW